MKWINRKTFFYFVVLIFAAFIRFYGLGIVPAGLTNDEADIGYDAFSIVETGKDQWNTFLPLTSFKGFGDYRVPLYTYLVVPVVALSDLNVFSVRLPSAIFGTLSVGLIYFVGKKLTEKSEISSDIISFSAMLLMAISPWAIGLSRIGIESNVGISIFLIALLLFLHAQKRIFLYIPSFILFGLTIYTYTSYALFTILSLIFLFGYFRKTVLKNKKVLFFSVTIFLLLTIPFFLFRSAVGTRASQVSFVFSQDSIGINANLNDRRGSCVEVFPNGICKIFENKYTVIFNTFTRNYINHFSPDFLYINGTTTQYSILPQRSLAYSIELLLFLSGIFALLKNQVKNKTLLLGLLLASPLADSITGDGHFSRASNMMPFLYLTEGAGFSFLIHRINKYTRLARVVLIGFALLATLSCVGFLLSYFSYFPKHYSSYGQFGYEDLAYKLEEKKQKYDRIYISKYSNDTKQYIYYLFYNKYNPRDFQQKKNVEFSLDNSWISIDRIENIYFVDRIPSEEELIALKNEKILLVSHPNEFPKTYEFTETIYDKNNNGVFTFIDSIDYLNFLETEKFNK